MPACLENLFLLVGLLNLDPSRSKFPSDNTRSFARHPRNWGPPRGHWSKYSHTDTGMHMHTCVHTYINTQYMLLRKRSVESLRSYIHKWRQSSLIHAVHVYTSLSFLLPFSPSSLISLSIYYPITYYIQNVDTLTLWRSTDMTFELLAPRSILFLFLYHDERTGHALMDYEAAGERDGWRVGG